VSVWSEFQQHPRANAPGGRGGSVSRRLGGLSGAKKSPISPFQTPIRTKNSRDRSRANRILRTPSSQADARTASPRSCGGGGRSWNSDANSGGGRLADVEFAEACGVARRVPFGADPLCDAAKALAQSFKPSAKQIDTRRIYFHATRECARTWSRYKAGRTRGALVRVSHLWSRACPASRSACRHGRGRVSTHPVTSIAGEFLPLRLARRWSALWPRYRTQPTA
jgi:hypothetical protein